MSFSTSIFPYFTDTLGVRGTIYALLILAVGIADMVFFMRYASIAWFRLSKRTKRRTDIPSVSVIIPLFSDNTHFLDFGLRRILEQKEVTKEVVVVYVGANEDYYADLCMLSGHYTELKTTQIALSPKYPISVKQAINIGIKAAQHSHVVVTYPSYTPSSDHWLSLMARGFQYSDIVIGYGGIEREAGIGNIFVRKFSLMGALPWLSAAVHGTPYSACSANFGYTKELYFAVKGFNHLNLNTGDGDLFLQEISSISGSSPVLSPKASVRESYWPGWKSWISSQRLLYTTFRYYPKGLRAGIQAEPYIRILFYALALPSVMLMPKEFALGAGALLLLHFTVAAVTVSRTSRRLGERHIVAYNPLFYVIEPILRSYILLTQSRREESLWR